MTSEHILVTGAGSGIGKEFVRFALEDGGQVIAVSLLDEELDLLRADFARYGERLVTHARDLSTPDAANALLHWCDEKGFEVGTLINNAGFALFGDVVEADLGRVDNMIGLNVAGMTKLAAAFGARMKARGQGNILNVGSTAGMVASPHFAIYGASKAYVNLFTIAMRAELRPAGVNVTLLTPGATNTKFAKTANIDTFAGKSMLKDLFAKGGASSAADVARAGYEGMKKGKAHILVGKGSMLASLARLLPLSAMAHLPTSM